MTRMYVRATEADLSLKTNDRISVVERAGFRPQVNHQFESSGVHRTCPLFGLARRAVRRKRSSVGRSVRRRARGGRLLTLYILTPTGSLRGACSRGAWARGYVREVAERTEKSAGAGACWTCCCSRGIGTVVIERLSETVYQLLMSSDVSSRVMGADPRWQNRSEAYAWIQFQRLLTPLPRCACGHTHST